MSTAIPLVVALSGSPSNPSRSRRLIDFTLLRLGDTGLRTRTLALAGLPGDALLRADTADPDVAAALDLVAEAAVVVIGTPIYKAAYSGLLKTFLDLLPQDGLAGKLVLPLATAGSAAHTLALDYALKPVLGALGARDVLPGVCATDSQVSWAEDAGLHLDAAIDARLSRGISDIAEWLSPRWPRAVIAGEGPAARPHWRVIDGARAALATS